MRPERPLDPPKQVVAGISGKVAFTDVGSGFCVMLVHGAPGSTYDFRWLTPVLQSWCRVITVDMPGFGAAAPAAVPATLEGRASYLAEILNIIDVRRCLVVGHSFGAAAAVALGALYPERVAALALLSPVGLRLHWGLRRFRGRRLLHKLVPVPVVGDQLLDGLRNSMVRGGFSNKTRSDEVARVLDLLAHFRYEDYIAHLDMLEQPVWIGHCEDDPLIEMAIVNELAERVGASCYERFPSGGHNPQKSLAIEISESLHRWLYILGVLESY